MVMFKDGNVVFGFYEPTVDSPYFERTDFCNIANNFTPIDSDRVVIGGGDINCRIGNKYLNAPFPGSH